MNIKSRLHLYPSKGPKTQAFIVGERKALLALSEKLKLVAQGLVGIDELTLYSNDGHEFQIVITNQVSEDEWQNLKKPEELDIIKTYNEIKSEMLSH